MPLAFGGSCSARLEGAFNPLSCHIAASEGRGEHLSKRCTKLNMASVERDSMKKWEKTSAWGGVDAVPTMVVRWPSEEEISVKFRN